MDTTTDTTKQTGTPRTAPGPEVTQGLDALAARAPDAGTEPGNAAPGAESQVETVDWTGIVQGGVDFIKSNMPNWVWPEKPVGMIVSGAATILNRMPLDQANAFLEKWGPYFMVGGGVLLVVKANTETVTENGETRTRIKPAFAPPPPEPEKPPA